VEALRACEAYRAHMKRWNLPAYFSLRFQDIGGGLEEQLGATGLAPAPAPTGGDPAFAYAAAAATWAALRRCVHPGVFLPPLGDRFLRLALQLVARYAAWVEGGLRLRLQAAEAAAVAAADPGQGEGGAADGEPPAPAGGWAAGASVEQLAALWQDVAALQAALQAHFAPRLVAALGHAGSGGGVGEALDAALGECDSTLEAAGAAALDGASGGLVDRCCEALKQLRGIVATFRMTSRTTPSRPSHYVSTILAPLAAFLGGEGGRGAVSGAARGALARAVVAGVAGRYCQLAEDTLATVRKTESSLRRLKSRKAPGAGGEGEGEAAAAGAAAQGTDQMISLQLFLDVQEFGRKAAAAGVAPEELDAYRALWAAVAPEGRADEVAL
jgi:hypothetical protein